MIRHPSAEQISAYIARDVSSRDAAVLTVHLSDCAECTSVADELRNQVAALGTLESPEPSPTMWAAIDGALERDAANAGGRYDSPFARIRQSWRSLCVGVAAGAALVTALMFVAKPSPHVAVSDEVSREDSARAFAKAVDDPLLAEAENELARATSAYERAASRLRVLLEKEQIRWDSGQRDQVARRLAGLDEAVARSRAVAQRDPADGAGAEMLFAAYQKQIDFLAEAVHQGTNASDEAWR